ncbi:Dolichyl-phosphate-mannose-protein mannosyltransferase-domain-containing protein [Gongronella butleri]|nr:Dolichyl-phosphate-mannose-protein mannosyltransferase-domain-containing protein [Gongronella butleri]
MDSVKRRHRPAPEQVYEPTPEKPFRPVPSVYQPNTRYPAVNNAVVYCQTNYKVVIPAVLTFLAFWTRFRSIARAAFVVWDEAHFGKFATYYLNNEFYFDVHPPLGKMLNGFAVALAGSDGTFKFESGADFPEGLHYGVMRAFNAFWGALMVPFAYWTARELHMSPKASILAATMVLCDTALLCISRFVLLDSMLLFFTCSSFFCLTKFHNQRHQPFSDDWWLWLALTGVNLGCVSSVKWVGLFAVALVGCYTIEDLWDKLGDLEMPKTTYIKHWVARIVCLIIVPALIYMLTFVMHFAVLFRSGPGDTQMSSLFQSNLKGSPLENNPLELAYGSTVTLKNYGYGGGLLHSHVQLYPEGSKQQQITCYHHRDDNNKWIVKRKRSTSDLEEETAEPDKPQLVQNGEVIRLVHERTTRNLHSHPVKAPVTNSHWEVSGYGNKTFGDFQDNWKIEIVKEITRKKYGDKNNINAMTTLFRLRHVAQNCLLSANNVLLPQWGFRQIEVTCDKRNDLNDPHTWWNIEENYNDKLPPAPRGSLKSDFFHDLWTVNVGMWTTNNALIPDPDKNDILSSTPSEWPMATVGLRMCGWDDNRVKFYLVGNPIVWWTSFSAIVGFVAIAGFYIIRMQRSIYDLPRVQFDNFMFMGKYIFLGWFLHYIPFFIMGRVTYLHHYFPALYFSIFMVPFLLEHATRQWNSRNQLLAFVAATALVIAVFLYFAPLAYGVKGPINAYKGRAWRSTWNLLKNSRE